MTIHSLQKYGIAKTEWLWHMTSRSSWSGVTWSHDYYSSTRVGVDYNHDRRLRFLIDYIVIIIINVIMFFEIL